MSDSTFAIFRNRDDTKVAIRALQRLGFTTGEMQVFQPKKGGAKDFHQVQRYQVRTGALLGAVVGTFAAVILCSLAGLGLMPVFSHEKFSGLAGFMVSVAIITVGAFFGAASGALIGAGVPDPAAKRYGQYLSAGGILLSVHSEKPEQVRMAQDILTATGGQDVQMVDERETWKIAHLERLGIEHFNASELSDDHAS